MKITEKRKINSDVWTWLLFTIVWAFIAFIAYNTGYKDGRDNVQSLTGKVTINDRHDARQN